MLRYRPVLGFLLVISALFLPGGTPLRAEEPSVKLVQSAPDETSLKIESLPEAWKVWTRLFQEAEERIELMQFYMVSREGGRLEPIIKALKEAGRRGVKVRILVANEMMGVYPEVPEALAKVENIELRPYDIQDLTGGILHAKVLIVDDQAYVGSQNFDWRSMEHILELGALVRDPKVVADLRRIFEVDWALGETPEAPESGPELDLETITEVRNRPVYVVASPPRLNPPGILPAEAELEHLLDEAESSISFQLLHYSPEDGRTYFHDIDSALRRAAARGVTVRMVVSNWNVGSEDLPHLKSLQVLPNVDVQIASIPEHSEGFIPYSRVIHSKILIVDDRYGWIGTSNWGEDYFRHSRGVELVCRMPEVIAGLEKVFGKLWKSEYVERLDVTRDYERPRIK